jgi:hypothetical protein
MQSERFYWGYCLLGLLYVLVKIVFVAADQLPAGAIAHGAIPAFFTILVGILAANDASKKRYWGLLMALPIMVITISPPFMYIKKGSEWLTEGRLPVLIIYMCIALIQLVMAVVAARRRPVGGVDDGARNPADEESSGAPEEVRG